MDDQHYFWDYPEFSGDILTLGLSIVENPLPAIPCDHRVSATVCSIITTALQAAPEKILFFVCDSIDAKQRARMRMFNRWYRNSKNLHLEKHNTSILSPDMELYASIMLHSHHPQKDHIIHSFYHLSRNTAEKLKSY